MPEYGGIPISSAFAERMSVAQPNYQYEKRQKDLAKKKKKEEKQQRKAQKNETPAADGTMPPVETNDHPPE